MKFIAVLLAIFGMSLCHAEVRSYIERVAIANEAANLVAGRAFADLDDKAELLRKSRARTLDGQWQLSILYRSVFDELGKLAVDDQAWQVVDKQLLALAQGRPSSTNLWLFYALHVESMGWKLRGTGFASTTTAQGRSQFLSYVGRARSILQDHKSQLASNPEWYARRILLATYLQEPLAVKDAIFAEGVAREALYYDLFFYSLDARMPPWGGNFEAMAKFMNQSLQYKTPQEGTSMYARLAWYSIAGGYPEVVDVPGVKWETMRGSFLDVLKAFPDDWNAQQFLLMACGQPDVEAARSIVKYVREAPSPALLKKNIAAFEACRDFALGKSKAYYIHDPRTGAIREVK